MEINNTSLRLMEDAKELYKTLVSKYENDIEQIKWIAYLLDAMTKIDSNT